METLDSIIKIGRVTAVKGRNVEVQVDTTKNASHMLYKGDLLKNVSVGSFIKIAKGFTYLVGKIEGEFIAEDKLTNDKFYKSEQDKIKRLLQISLVGYLEDSTFKQGIKELPLIDNEAFLLTLNEFNLVHSFVTKGEETFVLGDLAQEKGKPIELSVDRLFASHIGIFGNTGSGKSYTLAKLYHELLDKYKDFKKFKKNARFFIIDFNGEYVTPDPKLDDDVIIENKYKSVYRLSTSKAGSTKKYPVSNQLVNDDQFWALILHCTEKTQTPFVSRTLKSVFLERLIRSNAGFLTLIKKTLENLTTKINQEKGVITGFLEELAKFGLGAKISGLAELTEYYREKLAFHSNSKSFLCEGVYSNNVDFIPKIINEKVDALIPSIDDLSEIQVIRLKILFNFHSEVQNSFTSKEHIGPLMGRLDNRISELEKVVRVSNTPEKFEILTIVSLKDVSIHMRKVIPLLICKQIYEEKKGDKDKDKYLNIIIDEAHNILSYNSERESETWKDYRLETFEEIIKEGRKFGVFLTIASQRPSDISSTIISQLHNYFLHRLINNKDIEAVEKTISYLDKVSFDALPILPRGSCILAGQAAQLPVIIEVGRIDDKYKPFNETMFLTKHWID